ncbi:hypothetical protein [Pseudoprimorskyibacter insulae]|uniref:Uncharacterized protein n=1 Tax=Pseudoprimorskyibacter insulae TaxID=1695997 RepID=A0A2R8AUF5_9RHOB|nr:hypothetical protein [Pseudoprimorskyibacter insulae]SPF79673.1 hypothetical protein PRI8871_01470 [Pseudoprimorskyibacter insulae]
MQLGEITYNPSQGAFEALATHSTDTRCDRIACQFTAPLNTPLLVTIRALLKDARRQRKSTDIVMSRRKAACSSFAAVPVGSPM